MNVYLYLLCFLSFCIPFISFAAPPINDPFANRIMLYGSSGVVTGYTEGASIEPGEPYHLFAPNGENSLWWSWTAPSSGSFSFDVVNSEKATIVAVYQGDSLTNLTRLGENITSYLNFTAEAGSNYKIAVVTKYPNQNGQVIVRYYQESFSPWFTENTYTGFAFWSGVEMNGSLIYGAEYRIGIDMVRTNRFGIIGQDNHIPQNIQQPLTVIDKDKTIIVDNAHPEGLSSNYWITGFTDSSLLVYDRDRKMLVLFEIGKDGLSFKGELPSEEPFEPRLTKSLIKVIQSKNEDSLYANLYGASVYNKSLKKAIWTEPFARGAILEAFKNGVTCRQKPDPYMMTLEFGKRGKKYYTRKLPYFLSSFYNMHPDSKGGIFYWRHQGYGHFVTNSPFSSIKKNGKFLFENQELPDTDSLWRYGCYNGKYFYIIKPNGGSRTISGFKISKKITKLDSFVVNDFHYIMFTGKLLAIFTRITGSPTLYGFRQYDQKMKKLIWEVPPAEGDLRHLGNNVFSRNMLEPAGSVTNYTYKIFNQKGTIAEHTIAR